MPQGTPEAAQVAWVSLDEGDNEPVLFWRYALTALDSQLPGLCTALLAYLHTQQRPRPPLRSVLQALINTLASRTEHFLLVLDDYHLISKPEVHSSLTYLLEHLPAQLHLLLATRADPPLPLSRLRARGEVLEVRTKQLRCTPQEVMAFFTQVMGLHLPADLLQEVTARTEGWLVGLHLLGLSLQGQTAPATVLDEVSGSQRYILQYLLEEVLRRQPPSVQRFLWCTFMVAPYMTVARWLHDAETAVRATEPAPSTETTDTGARPPSDGSDWDNLLGEIAAYRAIITGYHLGEEFATLALCQQALAHLSEQNLVVRAEVAYAQSLASHSCGDIVAAIQCTRQATAFAQAAGNTSSTIFYLCRTVYSLLVRGKLREAVQVAEQAALQGTTPGGLSDAMVGWASIFHADVLREWNRLDEALSRVLQGVRLCEQTETIVSLYFGYTELMRVYLARGEMDAARTAFQRAEEAMAKTASPYRRDVYVIGDWVQFWVASGAFDRATHWTHERAQQASGPSPLARERQDVARARMLLAQKKPTEALSLLEPLQGIAEKQERLSHVIERNTAIELEGSSCCNFFSFLSVLLQE